MLPLPENLVAGTGHPDSPLGALDSPLRSPGSLGGLLGVLAVLAAQIAYPAV